MSKPAQPHPDSPFPRDESLPPVVDAYFDARGKGRSARSMLDEVVRDSSVLDDLARDREWIDEVCAAAPAPDQTRCILSRLGIDPDHFDRRRHRFTLLTRRLSTAAVLAFAFVVGMWARSSLVVPSEGQPVETAHRFERVIESLPIQMDPFDRVRAMMLEVGSTLAEPDATGAAPDRAPGLTHPSDAASSPSAPRRAVIREGPQQTDPGSLIDEEIDIDTLEAIYKDLGIV